MAVAAEHVTYRVRATVIFAVDLAKRLRSVPDSCHRLSTIWCGREKIEEKKKNKTNQQGAQINLAPFSLSTKKIV